MAKNIVKFSNIAAQMKYQPLTYYDYLLSEGIMLGRELTATDFRTGARKSVDNSTTAEVAANTPDQFVLNNRLHCFGAMNGATNLASTDFDTDWNKANASISVNATTDPNGNLNADKIIEDGSLAPHSATMASVPTSSGAYRFSVYLKQSERGYALLYVAGLNKGKYFDLINGTILGNQGGAPTDASIKDCGNGWYLCSITVTEVSTTSRSFQLFISPNGTSFSYQGDGLSGIYIYLPSIVNSNVAHAAFPDGSIAGATYGGDLLTFSPTYGATGYAAIPFDPYGWSNTGNPANAQPLIFEAGSFTVGLDASGFFTTSGGAISTKKPVSNTPSVIIVTWDGVNHTISVDNETPVSAASAVAPSGTLYLGNTNLGSKEAHALVGGLIGDSVLNSSDKQVLNDGITADLATFGGFR